MSTFTLRFSQREGRGENIDHITYSGFKRLGALKPVTVRLPVTTIAKMQFLAEQSPEVWESQQEMLFEMIESSIKDWIDERGRPEISKAFDTAARRALQHRGMEDDVSTLESVKKKKIWKVQIRDLVSHLIGRSRIAAPLGQYRMEEVGLGRYQLSGRDKPTFELSITEVSTYINGRHLKVEGTFP